eukprot:gene34681-42777_t
MSRFKAMVKNYNETARLVSSEGGRKFGIGESDRKKNIFTLEQKKEALSDRRGGDSDSEDDNSNDDDDRNSQDTYFSQNNGENDEEEEEAGRGTVDDTYNEEWRDTQATFYDAEARAPLDIEALMGSNRTSSSRTTSPHTASPLQPFRGGAPAPFSASRSSAAPPTATPSKKLPSVQATKGKKRAAAEISPELRSMCSDAILEVESGDKKLTHFKDEGKGSNKKDFSSIFAQGKEKEIDLEREKFEFTKENYASELALRREALKENTKAVAIAKLIEKGLDGDEVNTFMLKVSALF